MSQAQTESREGALNDIGPGSSGDRNEKIDTGDGHSRDGDRTATGASAVRASPERTADDAGLNARGGMPGSEKVQRTGKSALSAGPNRYITRLI